MNENARLLHDRIAAVCPIHGVSVGRWEDRSTWRIDARAEATDQEKEAALTAMAEFVPIDRSSPQVISDRQFFQALAMAGEITEEEALAAVKTGAIPALLQALIDTLPDEQKFAAEMLVSGATIFDRTHPMTAVLAAGMGRSEQQIVDLWGSASAL